MKTYCMKARANRYHITYGYLVRADGKAQAREKLQAYLDGKQLDCTALKTATVATADDLVRFKGYPKSVIR